MSNPLEPFKVDYSSFYKFVSSVGLVLIASAATIPWFVMRAAVPESFRNAAAEKTLERAAETRAEQYLLALQAYPWVSGSLVFLGLILTVYGLLAWRSRQVKVDADEDEAFRQRRVLGQTTYATQEERAQKLDLETNETESPATSHESEDDSASRVASPEASGASDSREADSHREANATRVADDHASQRLRLERLEGRVGELIMVSYEDTHSLETGVRVPTTDGPQRMSILDFVARARDPEKWTSFAVEVRIVSPRSPIVIDMLQRSMLRLAMAARGVPEGPIPRGRRGRPALARSVSLLVVIASAPQYAGARFGGTGRPPSTLWRIATERVEALNAVLLRKVGVLVLQEEQLPSFSPDDFHRRTLSLLQDPAKPDVDPGVFID
ncbi:hypothetical protein IFT77_00300 [Frigoribacterium sp. CFBP 13729]|uniref:hypothetical protein n=1 Tax=Frigoribacterium sp. CFBP 13729 TaxID=2775293 RepID=UPI00178633CF|nr:hypothetical protein [Frigoribacterium sp. CFBP 13729]MBD8608925.1 hypothetical protein [Frigoribacterium sp. CFBP 13729]